MFQNSIFAKHFQANASSKGKGSVTGAFLWAFQNISEKKFTMNDSFSE